MPDHRGAGTLPAAASGFRIVAADKASRYESIDLTKEPSPTLTLEEMGKRATTLTSWGDLRRGDKAITEQSDDEDRVQTYRARQLEKDGYQAVAALEPVDVEALAAKGHVGPIFLSANRAQRRAARKSQKVPKTPAYRKKQAARRDAARETVASSVIVPAGAQRSG